MKIIPLKGRGEQSCITKMLFESADYSSPYHKLLIVMLQVCCNLTNHYIKINKDFYFSWPIHCPLCFEKPFK